MEIERSGPTIVYLGPPATHTHLACIKYFGNSIQALPKESLQEIFETVEREEADYGVAPVENSTEGSVHRTLDLLIHSEVKICGEVMMQVSHDLLSRSGRREDIQKIYSHPQALEQCRTWLRKNFPHAELAETTSTAKAAQIAMEDKAVAAVSSSLAARLYGLKLIESGIENHSQNYTRFLILGQQFKEKTGRDRTSILFSIPHSPGSLFRVLKPFEERKINLTKIESRPVKNKPWEYIFFLDFEGHIKETPIYEMLEEMKNHVLFMKFLGSYPRNPLE